MAVGNIVVELVDQYKVERLLAVKPYTEQYLAYDVDEDHSATLDILRPDARTQTGFAAQFISRARAIAQIRHPNILKIYAVGRTPDEYPYVSQLHVDGYPLSQRLEQLAARATPVNSIYALKLVRQLADALLLATRLDLVHYDLRPQNVLLKNVALPTDDALVLTDLFVPFERRNWNADAEAAEYVAYLSPEQRAGKDIDAASHVYSLGALAYQLLGGQAPSGPVKSPEVWLRRLTAAGTPLERVRGGLAPETYELVDRALRNDPKQRYETIEAFVAALDRALVAEELLIGAPGALETTPARRSWGVLTVVVLLALGVVAAVTAAQLISSQGAAAAVPVATTVTEQSEAQIGEVPPGGDQGGQDGGGAAAESGATGEAVIMVPVATDTPAVAATDEPPATATAPPSATASPTAEPSATASATTTSTPTPLPPSPTPEPSVQVVLNSVNLRRGPGINYPQVGFLLQGDSALVLSRYGENENAWFEVLTDDGRVGWLSAAVVELADGVAPEEIPVASAVPPPPTPTPTPTATPTLVPTATPTSPPAGGGNGGDGGSQPPPPTQPAVEPTRTPPIQP